MSIFLQNPSNGPQLLAVVAGLWLCIAACALILALRARNRLLQMEAWGGKLQAIIATTPEPWLIIDSAGVAHSAPLLAQWLGLDGRARPFADYGSAQDCGFWPEDHARLTRALARLVQSGVAFAMPVRISGSPRILLAQGRALLLEAESQVQAILWFADQSETVEGARADGGA